MFVLLALGATARAAAPCCGGMGGRNAETAPSPAQAALRPSAPEAKPQTHCPVMNAPINRNLYVDHNGKRIYVCCQGCLSRVRAEPEKYIRLLEEMGVEPEKTPPQN